MNGDTELHDVKTGMILGYFSSITSCCQNGLNMIALMGEGHTSVTPLSRMHTWSGDSNPLALDKHCRTWMRKHILQVIPTLMHGQYLNLISYRL